MFWFGPAPYPSSETPKLRTRSLVIRGCPFVKYPANINRYVKRQKGTGRERRLGVVTRRKPPGSLATGSSRPTVDCKGWNWLPENADVAAPWYDDKP